MVNKTDNIMIVERLGKNYYKFEDGFVPSFDSYTNLLQYKGTLMTQLDKINLMITEVEAIGFTAEDLAEEEVV